jgi:hypothetical protein
MSMTEEKYQKLWKEQNDRLIFIEKTLKILTIKNGINEWVSEDEATILTGLGSRRLFDLRKNFTLDSKTASGRKIQYSRKSIEKYLNKYTL